MEKECFGWPSDRLPAAARVARWGHYGRPVLVFPTAGGDFEEVERHGLVAALAPLIDAGRIKVYSIDSVAGRHWIEKRHAPQYSSRVQNLFDAFIYQELVPLIRQDCASAAIEIVVSGASIGAFNAVATLCRHPDAFRLAIGMSGTYDLSRYVHGHWNDDFYFSSPMHYLPGLRRGLAARGAAHPPGYSGLGFGSLGEHRRVPGHGRGSRWQGNTEPGGRLGSVV